MSEIIDLNTGKLLSNSVNKALVPQLEVESQGGDIINLDTGEVGSKSATDIKQEIKKQRDNILNELASSQTPLNAFLISAGRTTKDLGRFFTGEEETDIEKESLGLLSKKNTFSTIAGQTLPFLAGGVSTGGMGLPARFLASLGIGGLEGAVISKQEGKDVTKGAASGAAIAGGFELAFPVLSRVTGALFTAIKGKLPYTKLLNNDGLPTRELDDILKEKGTTFDDVVNDKNFVDAFDAETATQAERLQFLKEQNLIPTRAQVTGDITDFQTQQELAKTTGKVSTLLQKQENTLLNKFENKITETGGSSNPSNAPVFDFIADKAIDLDKAISNSYKAARDIAGDNKIVKVTSLITEIKKIAGSNDITGGLPSAVKDILIEKGLITGKGLQSNARVTPKVAEEIRIQMNGLYDSLKPFGREKLKLFKDALDNDVARDVGKDIFEEARGAKALFEKQLRRAKVNKFDSRNKNLLRDVLENKINPDRFINDAVASKSVRSSDLQQVKSYVLDGNSTAGAQAWNDLRGQVLDDIKNTAFSFVGGEPAITRAALDKALNKYGKDKLRVLFTREERKFFDDMKKITAIREPKRKTQQGLGPSAQAVIKAIKITNLPLVRESFEGLVRKLENSAALSIPEAAKSNQAARLLSQGAATATIAQDNK